MKKNFWKLLIIFGVLLCIFAFYGCGEETETTAQSSEITTAEATEITSESEETTSEVSETTSAAGTTSEAEETSVETTETEAQTLETSETEETSAQTEETTAETEETSDVSESTTAEEETSDETSDETTEASEETTEDIGYSGPIQERDKSLVYVLIDYLRGVTTHNEALPPRTVEDKINSIKNGMQALHIGFDSTTEYYFVCGYFDKEDHGYDYAEEYTWIRYEKENEIQEYYNDEIIVVAFQINKALFVEDILPSDKAVPDVEHFLIYEPEFVDGFNVNTHIVFYKTFIYLNSFDLSTVYCCSDLDSRILTCVFFENQYCIMDHLFTIDSVGRKSKIDLEASYGEYYDIMMEIMIAEKGVAGFDGSTVTFFGLFPINEFVDKLLK